MLEPTLNIINGISNRSKRMIDKTLPTKPFDDLYSILCRKELLIQALGNIKNNKGSMTSGIDDETIDGISLKKIEMLSAQLKQKNFLFKPIRRVLIPKPGKTKKRPLGIPNFTDRIVQEGIRIILENRYWKKKD